MSRFQQRDKLFTVLLMTVSVGLALVITEIGVRVFLPYNTPDTVRNHAVEYLPSIFARHRLKPINRLADDRKGWDAGTQMQRGYFINDLGFRGPSFQARKPKGMCRAVIIGGSTVFDQDVLDYGPNETNDWPHVAERYLKSKGFENIEVINAGVPGHTTFDSLGRLYSQIWMLEPDAVLLYEAWNDMKYFRKITPETPLITHFKPYDDKADSLRNYKGWLDYLLCYSQLYVKLRTRYFVWKFNMGPEGAKPSEEYHSTYSQDAVKQYKLNVELVVDASRNIRAIPILLTQATLVSPRNSEEERKKIYFHYQQLTHEALVRAYQEANQTVRTVAQEKGVTLLDLDKMFSGRGELFNDHSHTTERGGKELASAVSGVLEEQLKTCLKKSS
jgi:lysophospholipase L1-like esterase